MDAGAIKAVAILVGLAFLGGVAWWLRRSGRLAQRGEDAARNAETKDRQLQRATEGPRDQAELVDRLRRKDGGL